MVFDLRVLKLLLKNGRILCNLGCLLPYGEIIFDLKGLKLLLKIGKTNYNLEWILV
jgi:hypothetical protein